MSKKVLIAEDYADVRSIMKFWVSRQGYQVIEASDGYEAVEMARQHNPDLILMDLSMPIMDGVAATQIIKGFSDSNIPIIALTAHGDSYYRKAIKAGCNEVINKPLEFKALPSLLNQYLHD